MRLAGSHAYLFELLCAHAQHEHVDRHLATHVATLHRGTEGHVLINGHPAFGDSLNISAMINEPGPKEKPSLKMTETYLCLLCVHEAQTFSVVHRGTHDGIVFGREDSDPLMQKLGLVQPQGAVAAWHKHIRLHAGLLSEKMIVYITRLCSYQEGVELTGDYGKNCVCARVRRLQTYR